MKITGTAPSSDGVHTLKWFSYVPENPAAAVLIIHGMAEYKERYDYCMQSLEKAGIASFCYDQLGHGETVNSGDERGFFAHKDGVKYIIEDVHGMLALVRSRCPGIKTVLLGHSMGSFIVRLYASTYGDIDMLAVSGTSGTNPGVGAGIFLSSVSCAFRGDKYKSAFIDKLAMGGNCKRFRSEELPAQAWLSHDLEIRRDMEKKSFMFTVSGMRDMFRLLNLVSKDGSYDKIPKELPVYMFSGDEDPIGNYGKGFSEVVGKMRARGINVKERLYENGRHEMLNETNKDEVIKDLTKEIKKVFNK